MSSAVLILSPLCAVAGFLLKLYADKYTQHKISMRERRVASLEYKLKEFYFPFYTNLKSESIVSNMNIKGEAVFELEKFVMKCHLENQKIIMAHMVAAALHGKLLPVKGLYRAGMQTRLLDTT